MAQSSFQVAEYRHDYVLPALPDPEATIAFDDDASEVEEEAEIVGRSGGGPTGGDEEEEGAEDDMEHEELDPALLRSRLDEASFVPLTGRPYKRKVLLPDAFYDRQGPGYIPRACVNGCSYSSHNAGCARSEESGGEDAEARWDLPLLFFKLFFSEEVFEQLAANTNAYAAAEGAGAGRPWRATSAAELKIWIGLIIYMSVHRQSSVKEYWNRSGQAPLHCIMRFRGMNRFN